MNSVPAVEVDGVSKNYGSVSALKPTSFAVPEGRYFVLLGPSGGGKTTTLRMIAGLIRPTTGRVRIGGRDVTDQPANRRDTAMVFQGFALFPHMTVEQNVAYGLELRRLPKDELRDRTAAMLRLVGLTGFEARRPSALSGGQQQRVQLARALVLQTSIVLLDEPLAALDATLRKDMCFELKHIQESVGTTFIHVTHNQEEAMTVADEIALIAAGTLVESGSPREVYETPRCRFTAEFIGENAVFSGPIVEGALRIGGAAPFVRDAEPPLAISVAAENIDLHLQQPDLEQTLPGTVVDVFYLGFSALLHVEVDGGPVVPVRLLSKELDAGIKSGGRVWLSWDPDHARMHTA
ncbi:spermidine/putrescine ABC transporter ATPase subunit [alpha proteobacterium BAL199]|jgi:ABC-type Fe3+/spermidine/putrescine transport system ATPase subunit|nr:spermidine/putrescine ABC transporter ATPase subunit [alpha proteobacterium BAL199]